MKIVRKLKYPLTFLLVISIIIFTLLINKKLNDGKYENIVFEEDSLLKEDIEISKEDKDIQELCNIDIKGAINKPGVYQVDCDNTVNDVIKLASGLTKNADTSVTNLAKKVNNEMVIIIYTKEEVKNSNIVDTVIKVVEKECICPNIQNDGCINTEIEEEIGNSNSKLININTANLETLQELPGIGESKANSIIKYREEVGKFNSIEDLLNVDGIGSNLYEQIKIYITT